MSKSSLYVASLPTCWQSSLVEWQRLVSVADGGGGGGDMGTRPPQISNDLISQCLVHVRRTFYDLMFYTLVPHPSRK